MQPLLTTGPVWSLFASLSLSHTHSLSVSRLMVFSLTIRSFKGETTRGEERTAVWLALHVFDAASRYLSLSRHPLQLVKGLYCTHSQPETKG